MLKKCSSKAVYEFLKEKTPELNARSSRILGENGSFMLSNVGHSQERWSKEKHEMIYQLLAHFTISIHFVWILFLVFGIFFALRWPKIAIFHLGGLLFSLVLNIFSWYCPLTYLENDLRRLYDVNSAYSGPFTATYLERIVYPDLPELYIRVGEIFFVILYVGFYIYLVKRHHLFGRIRKK